MVIQENPLTAPLVSEPQAGSFLGLAHPFKHGGQKLSHTTSEQHTKPILKHQRQEKGEIKLDASSFVQTNPHYFVFPATYTVTLLFLKKKKEKEREEKR